MLVGWGVPAVQCQCQCPSSESYTAFFPLYTLLHPSLHRCGTMLPQESALMAQVICRQLGLQGGSINDGSSYTTENGASDTSGGDSVNSDGSDGEGGSDGDGSKKKKKKKKEEKAAAGPPLLLSSVNCTGSEASLSECAFSLPSELDCPEGSVGVGVACSV